MKKIKLAALTLVLLLGLFFAVQTVSAHETVTVGDYAVEYGWLNEPAIMGQPNALVVNLSLASASASSTTPPADIDTSALVIQAVYGDQTKTLTLQPLAEDTHNQFIAPMTPMLAGTYTIHFSGSIGSTQFNKDVQPEEVKTADVVQFPVPAQAASASGGVSGWMGIAGIVLGALGTVLGGLALLRKPR